MNVIRAHSIPQSSADVPPLALLTIAEAARELRCSRTHLNRILCGRVADLSPLPVFHIGRSAYIRNSQLQAWVRSLEDRERENRYASGCFGVRDEDWESIAGA
jgi:hypothetical protein